jgi:tetratricopeptide (TPR) repeat protein
VDTQTRHALKQDSFVTATTSSIGWLQEHRSSVLKVAVPAVIAIVAILAGVIFYNQRSEAALVALGKGFTIYASPVRQAGMPEQMAKESFASYPDRAKAANQQFVDTANKYGWTLSGKNAEYFAGVTFMEMGQNGEAEKAFHKTVDSGNANLESLGKLALAGLYSQSKRETEAIDLLKQLIAKPTAAVPAATAQLQLAALYETTRPEEAKKIYAEIKDKDKTGPAGQIAATKLSGPAKPGK